MNFSSIVFFAVLANLDNLIIGLSYGIKRIRIMPVSYVIIALITFAGTLLSMYLGKSAAHLMPAAVSNAIGGIIMVCIGVSGLIKYYRSKRARSCEDARWPVENPEKYDTNHNQRIDYNETAVLGLALAVNNMGLGIGASISGMPVIPASVAVFFASIIFMLAGNLLGNCAFCRIIGGRAELISALCIIALGVWEILC